MFKKKMTLLAICALTACSSDPKPEGLGLLYNCTATGTTADSGLELTIKTRLKTSDKIPSFDLAGTSLDAYELYQTGIAYYSLKRNAEKPQAFKKQIDFEYENVEFEYDNDDLILKVPAQDDLPSCVIKFDKRSNVANHTCAFEKEDIGYRAKTFEMQCSMAGKMKHLSFK